VCYGTSISLSFAPKTKIAPDISIQKHDSTDEPDESMVELIMDAKYKYDDNATLPVLQIHAFMNQVNVLQTENADRLPLVLDKLSELKSNCILTNGKVLAKHQAFCASKKIKQVGNFDLYSKFEIIG
jgi:hypothetical protein